MSPYLYVLNNPLKYIDPDGEIPKLVGGAILGGIIGAGTQLVGDIVRSVQVGEWNPSGWESYLGATLSGVATGALIGTGVLDLHKLGVTATGVYTLTTQVTQTYFSRKNNCLTFWDIIGNTYMSAGTGFFMGSMVQQGVDVLSSTHITIQPLSNLSFNRNETMAFNQGISIPNIQVGVMNPAVPIFTPGALEAGMMFFDGGGNTGRASHIPEPNTRRASNELDYRSNSKHTPGGQGFNRRAGIEPRNSFDLFEQSASSNQSQHRFTFDEATNTVHRFSPTNDGSWHWSGSTNQPNTLTRQHMPRDIIDHFGLNRRRGGFPSW